MLGGSETSMEYREVKKTNRGTHEAVGGLIYSTNIYWMTITYEVLSAGIQQWLRGAYSLVEGDREWTNRGEDYQVMINAIIRATK